MDILITDKEKGPVGWEMIPVDDVNVFYNPKTVDEATITQMVEDFANGDTESMDENATFDTPLDREEF
jgi:hypothetical protein